MQPSTPKLAHSSPYVRAEALCELHTCRYVFRGSRDLEKFEEMRAEIELLEDLIRTCASASDAPEATEYVHLFRASVYVALAVGQFTLWLMSGSDPCGTLRTMLHPQASTPS